MMILPLLLAVSAPAADEYPEPPSPCDVSWAEGISSRFVDGTQKRITRRCRELVDALGYDNEPGSIRVEVGGETYAFTVRVDLVEDGEVVYAQEQAEDVCECGGNELSAFAMKRVAAAIEEHRKAAAEHESAPPPSEPEQHDEEQPPPAPKERHGMRWAGVAVGTAGAATLIAGAVMRPQEETGRIQDGEGRSTETRPRFEPRNTAIMIGVGAVAASVGVGLIVADAIVSKKRKRERSALITPAVTTTSFSIALQTRF